MLFVCVGFVLFRTFLVSFFPVSFPPKRLLFSSFKSSFQSCVCVALDAPRLFRRGASESLWVCSGAPCRPATVLSFALLSVWSRPPGDASLAGQVCPQCPKWAIRFTSMHVAFCGLTKVRVLLAGASHRRFLLLRGFPTLNVLRSALASGLRAERRSLAPTSCSEEGRAERQNAGCSLTMTRVPA